MLLSLSPIRGIHYSFLQLLIRGAHHRGARQHGRDVDDPQRHRRAGGRASRRHNEASLKETPAAVLAVSRGGCRHILADGTRCGVPVHIKKPSLSTDPTKVGGNGKPVHWTIYHWCKRQVCPKAGKGVPHPELKGQKSQSDETRHSLRRKLYFTFVVGHFCPFNSPFPAFGHTWRLHQ